MQQPLVKCVVIKALVKHCEELFRTAVSVRISVRSRGFAFDVLSCLYDVVQVIQVSVLLT